MPEIQFSHELLSLVERAAFKGELHLLREVFETHDNSGMLLGLAVECAAKKGDLAIIQELLKNGAMISKECRGQAVINAAKDGHSQVIQELLKNKAVILLEDWKSALSCAVENGHLDSVHELTENVPIDGLYKSPRRWAKRRDDFL